jgi:hypothetical protein
MQDTGRRQPIADVRRHRFIGSSPAAAAAAAAIATLGCFVHTTYATTGKIRLERVPYIRERICHHEDSAPSRRCDGTLCGVHDGFGTTVAWRCNNSGTTIRWTVARFTPQLWPTSFYSWLSSSVAVAHHRTSSAVRKTLSSDALVVGIRRRVGCGNQ